MPLTDGAMQAFPLTLDRILDHAAKWHGASGIAGSGDAGIEQLDYARLRLRALAGAAGLAALGVQPGDRVATLAWNSVAHVEAWYAIMGMGAVCHTLNPRLTAAQLADMLVRSGARVVVASADLLPLATEVVDRAPAVTQLLVCDGEAGARLTTVRRPVIESFAAMVDRASPEDARWGGFDETAPCGLCFTSGTTGPPKGVTYTHRSNYLHTLRLLQADVLALTAADVVLAVVPMFHANAWGLPFAAPACGAKLVLPGRAADGASLARLIAAEGVTVAAGVPTVWLGLVEHVEATGVLLPSLRRILVGGSPMPPALMRRIEQVLDTTVQTSWGMTELSPLGTMAAPGDDGRSAAAVGRPALGVDLLLTDAAGRPLPEQRNGEGHLHVRGPAVVERYYGAHEPATNADGWFDTGDLARLDRDGNLFITGRSKDLIKSGGEWINPLEIEAVVGALPQVSLAAVIGRSDPKWGERPILLVETIADAVISDEELLAPLRGRVAPWWIPDDVVRLTNMPLASTGKIDKMRLRIDHGGT